MTHINPLFCFVCGPTVTLIQVTVRHAKTHQSPKICNMKLDHNHVINREAIEVKLRLAGKLTDEQREQIQKMTSESIELVQVGRSSGTAHS